MKTIKNIVGKYNKEAFVVVVLTTICNILALLFNFYYKHLIDALATKNSAEVYKYLAVILAFQLSTTFLTLYIYDYYLNYFKLKISSDLKKEIIKNIFKFPFSKSRNINIGKINTILFYDTQDIADYVSLYYFMVISNTLRFFITYFLLFRLDFYVGLFVLVSVPFYFLLTEFSMKYMKKFTALERESVDKINHSVINKIENLKAIKSMGLEESFSKEFSKDIDVMVKNSKSFIFWKAIFYLIRNFLSSFLPIFIIFISAIRILNGNMTVGTIFAITGFIDAVYIPIGELNHYKSMKNNLEPVMERTEEYIEKSEDEVLNDVIITESEKPYISIENLTYSINDEKIMDNVNLKIENNGLYVLKGENGRGKSTLLNIVSGLLKNFDGRVEIGNGNNELKALSYMNQENDLLLFDKNIIENNINIFDNKNIYDLMNLFEFNKTFSENKVDINEFSGGEKRRILFLRTLNVETNIYLFDEPLENLDEHSKEVVVKEIAKLSRDKIVLLVSHSLEDFEKIGLEFKEITF